MLKFIVGFLCGAFLFTSTDVRRIYYKVSYELCRSSKLTMKELPVSIEVKEPNARALSQLDDDSAR